MIFTRSIRGDIVIGRCVKLKKSKPAIHMNCRFKADSMRLKWVTSLSLVYFRYKENLQLIRLQVYGGRYKTRTCDLPHVKRMRYQLRQSSSSLTACLYYLRKRKMSIPFLIFLLLQNWKYRKHCKDMSYQRRLVKRYQKVVKEIQHPIKEKSVIQMVWLTYIWIRTKMCQRGLYVDVEERVHLVKTRVNCYLKT